MPHSLLITLEYPPQKGGVANYYAGVATHWQGGMTVLTQPWGNPNDQITITKQITNSNLQIIRKPLIGHFWPHWLTGLRTVLQLVNTLTREYVNIDLIQVGHVLPLGYVALLIKWLHGIPYLVYTHGMDITVPARSRWKRTMLKLILRNAKLVVAASEFTKAEVVKLGIASEKMVVVYPCPSLENPNDQIPMTKQISNPNIQPLQATSYKLQAPIILTVSRLVARKGIDTVLAALPQVIKKVPHVQYVVIGTGPELNSYKLQATSYKLGDYVQFLGEISDEEKIAWYKKANVFVLVPKALGGDVEGFGTVYLEANSVRLPVVASRTGGVKEAVLHGVNGLLVAPHNPQETAQALLLLLTDKPLADKLGMKGAQRVHKEFTWNIQLQKLHQALT